VNDVVVIGGGPGGSTTAGLLAKRGRRVVLFEQVHHPRFHLGESLLPGSMGTLESLGVLDDVRTRFQLKRGAQFYDDVTGKFARFDFADAFNPAFPYAFQVPRDEFDELLLRRATTLGVDVREGWTVTRVRFEGTRAVGVDVKDPTGGVHAIDARFVVDASGRDAMTARAHGATRRIPKLENTALFSQWTGCWRDDGAQAGDILILLCAAGWFWFIPFNDGRTSVGAVVSNAWMKTRRPGESVDDLYKRALAETAVARRFVDGGTQLWPAGATADFSFRVGDLAGDGWLTVGDAGGFIDPLFSTGAHLAMTGASLAAPAIDDALRDGDVRAARFADFTRAIRGASELFIGAVQSFYDGELTKYLFAERPRPFLKKSITSMLAGDVFTPEARWSSDLRTRFSAQLPDEKTPSAPVPL
jgi:flavin-dependent dehydrogenase